MLLPMRLPRASMECLLAGVPAVLLFIWWMGREAGYFERSWMPGAVLLLVIGAASVIAQRAEIALPSRAAKLAVAALGAYVLWSFASILWASNAGDALEGSQRALLYLTCFALFALLPWTPRTVLSAMVAFVAVMTVVGIVTALRLAGAAPLRDLLTDAQLTVPSGYHSAAAALWTMAAVPALALAARRELSVWLRPLLLACATFLLGLAVLCQSRGWLYTLPIVLLAALLLSPDRLRLLLFGAVALVELAIAAPDLLAVNTAGNDLDPQAAGRVIRPVIDHAMLTLAATSVGALVAGAALVYAERTLGVRIALGRRARRLIGVALVAAVAAGGAGAVMIMTDGDPVARIESKITEFTSVDGEATDGESHLASLGSTRYDFWRVALDIWREHPVLGLGQDNFGETYTRLRSGAFEEPRWVHSLPLRLLAHTGLVGAALFLAFLGALALATRRAWQRAPHDGGRAAIGAALLPCVVWLAHGSVDWLWEFPALSCAALALAGAALALGRGVADEAAPPRSQRARRAIVAGALGAVVAGVLLLVPSLVADSEVSEAALHWRADPSTAEQRLATARALNPLAARPWLVEGTIEMERKRYAAARNAFARAAAKQPDAWYPQFAAGLAASAAGDVAGARARLRAALARNPRDPLIPEALRRLEGAPMTFAQALRRIDERLDLRRNQVP